APAAANGRRGVVLLSQDQGEAPFPLAERIRLVERPGELIECGLRLLAGDAGSEPAGEAQPADVVLGDPRQPGDPVRLSQRNIEREAGRLELSKWSAVTPT